MAGAFIPEQICSLFGIYSIGFFNILFRTCTEGEIKPQLAPYRSSQYMCILDGDHPPKGGIHGDLEAVPCAFHSGEEEARAV
jgi:hypothetical protein